MEINVPKLGKQFEVFKELRESQVERQDFSHCWIVTSTHSHILPYPQDVIGNHVVSLPSPPDSQSQRGRVE